MKLKKILKTAITLTIIACLSYVPVFADVGSFDRYDSGSSSSDWSSSSSSWDSDDWSSSSSSWDDDYSSGDAVFLIAWLFGTNVGRVSLFVILIIVAIAMRKKRRENNSPYESTTTYIPPSVYTSEVHDVPVTHTEAEKIKQIDPMFSEEDFISWTKDLYVKMQHAWTDRKWEEIRPLETEKLFEQHNAQLQDLIKNKKINVVEQIAVNYATILSFRQTEDKDIVDVALKATKKDYVIDETTKNVLQGNKNQDRITVYKMTFERTKGTLTKKGTEKLDAKNCPNCGAPLKITSSGKCEYCGSIVSTGVHDWVLSNIEPLRK